MQTRPTWRLVRYDGDYSNRARGARRLALQHNHDAPGMVIDEPPVNWPRQAHWARLIQQVVALGHR